MKNRITSAGAAADSEQKAEVPTSSQNNAKHNVVRSPSSKFPKKELDIETQWYLDKITEWESQGWSNDTIDGCKINLILSAIRQGKCYELVNNLKNLFEYDRLLQVELQRPKG